MKDSGDFSHITQAVLDDGIFSLLHCPLQKIFKTSDTFHQMRKERISPDFDRMYLLVDLTDNDVFAFHADNCFLKLVQIFDSLMQCVIPVCTEVYGGI